MSRCPQERIRDRITPLKDTGIFKAVDPGFHVSLQKQSWGSLTPELAFAAVIPYPRPCPFATVSEIAVEDTMATTQERSLRKSDNLSLYLSLAGTDFHCKTLAASHAGEGSLGMEGLLQS